jgi:hypothetical protein
VVRCAGVYPNPTHQAGQHQPLAEPEPPDLPTNQIKTAALTL